MPAPTKAKIREFSDVRAEEQRRTLEEQELKCMQALSAQIRANHLLGPDDRVDVKLIFPGTARINVINQTPNSDTLTLKHTITHSHFVKYSDDYTITKSDPPQPCPQLRPQLSSIS